jgi:fucose 4-O-acetylase-like acetyltransferase
MRIKKLIAPFIITCIITVLLVYFVIEIINAPDQLGLKIMGAIIVLFLLGGSIFVFIERIKEIRSGEEDDLSQY